VLKDLEDGLILIQLAELLTGKKVPAYERNPRMMVTLVFLISIPSFHQELKPENLGSTTVQHHNCFEVF